MWKISGLQYLSLKKIVWMVYGRVDTPVTRVPESLRKIFFALLLQGFFLFAWLNLQYYKEYVLIILCRREPFIRQSY
jgi:hypothetical protein